MPNVWRAPRGLEPELQSAPSEPRQWVGRPWTARGSLVGRRSTWGPNSFRLEICEAEHGQLVRAEYLKDTVRLGAGLDESSRLNDAAMRRGWDCLARFAERVHGFEAQPVRAVATQTLREARNREFVAGAEVRLGHPIDVISGHEEARLIYSGVSHHLPHADEPRLVFDIGGRSTELIVGVGSEPR